MITEDQFKDAALMLRCNVSSIKAVYAVEASGSGYLDDGRIKGVFDSEDRVKILFEGHRFWKNIKKAGANPATFILKNPQYKNVLYEKWDKSNYKGGAGEWTRMSLAIEVCNELNIPALIALDSASYGAFQIMGENCKECGYATSQEMLAAYNKGGEAEQLLSFCRLILKRKLDDELRNKQFAKFAAAYNGTAYRENLYDIKLINADKKYSLT